MHLVDSPDADVPPAFDGFEEWRAFCLEYRMSLGKIARLTACLLPEPALAAASRRLGNALQACSTTPATAAALEVGNSAGADRATSLLCLKSCTSANQRAPVGNQCTKPRKAACQQACEGECNAWLSHANDTVYRGNLLVRFSS